MGIYSTFKLFFSVIIMVGLLGLIGWKVTVISSNFIALMLILTMAMNIHMSVRYLQFKKKTQIFRIVKQYFGLREKCFGPYSTQYLRPFALFYHLFLVTLNLL